MKWVRLEELNDLITENGRELVYVLEDLLMHDSFIVYDEKTGKEVWLIQDYDSLYDGLDIIGEKLEEYKDKVLMLEYYYRWSTAQFTFSNDPFHQVYIKVYYLSDGNYEMLKIYDDGTYEIETLHSEKDLMGKMGWHGYGRVLYFTFISDDTPREILRWIKDRGSWAEVLHK